jgi:hypothetical protein
MMVCTQCGFRNETEDAFCGSCGAFLEWSGEKVETDEPAPAAPTIAETPAPPEELPATPSAEPAPEPAAASALPFPPGPSSRFRGEEPPPPAAEGGIEAAIGLRAEPKAAEGGVPAAKPDGRTERASQAPATGGPEPGAGAGAGTGTGAVSLSRPAEVAEPAGAAKAAGVGGAAGAAAEARTGGPAVAAGTPTQAPPRARTQTPPPRAPAKTTPARTPGAGPAAGPVARRPDERPTAAKPRPVPSKPPPKRELRPGDLVCNQCQEGNDPNRKFCRRCGASLVEAVEAVPPPPLPWWKRLFVRQPKVVAAGERPMRRGGSTARRDLRSRLQKARRVTALLAVLGLGVGLVGPWRSTVKSKVTGAFRGAKEKVVPKLSPVTPVGAEATSSLAGHPPTMAIDRAKGNDNFWAEGAKGDGVGQKLIVNFKPAIRLGRIGFTLGASTKPEDFVTEPRPRTVRLHFPDQSTKDLQLKDIAEFQDYPVDAKDVGRLEIEIREVFPSTQGKSDCWISEVEFFERT